MPSLPTELHYHIIETLGRPTHPSAYRLPPENSRTLAQLCLVNSTFRKVAEPLLYTRPWVTPTSVRKFRETVVYHHRFNNTGAVSFFPTEKAFSVKRLAMVHFEEDLTLNQISDIAQILYALSGILERLFFDVFLRPVDYAAPLDNDLNVSLRAAIRGLFCIVEFCTMRSFPWNWDPMPWASARPLRRLVTFGPSLHYKLTDTLKTMTNLQYYIGAFPSLTGTQVAGLPLRELLDHVGPGFKEMVLVVPTEDITYTIGFKKLIGEVMEEEEMIAQGDERKKINVAEARTGAYRPARFPEDGNDYQWTFNAIADGTIWSIHRMPWDRYRVPRISF